MFNKSKLILVLGGIKNVNKRLSSTYYCLSIYHARNCARLDEFHQWDKTDPLPSWSFQFRIKCKWGMKCKKGMKSLHLFFKSWSVFSLMFDVIHRGLAIPTKAYTKPSSEFHQKHISPLQLEGEKKMKEVECTRKLVLLLLQVRTDCNSQSLYFLPFGRGLSLSLSFPG